MSVRPSELTTSDMEAFMHRLCANYGGKKDFEARCLLYHEKLKRFPVDVVRQAIDRAIESGGEYFPKVHKLIEHAKAIERAAAGEDHTPRAQMRTWEIDPFDGVIWTEEDARGFMPSTACPICGECLEWSPRGYVIAHDEEKHLEAKVSYSNIGRPEWFKMGPPTQLPPAPKKPKQLPKPARAAIAAPVKIGEVLVSTAPGGVPIEPGDAYEEGP